VKGILLAGGTGSRLHPATLAVSKQLLPVYDKPMVYYPLSVLMLAGVRDVLVISTPHDLPLFERLLGDGSRFGMSLSYASQAAPEGIAQAFVIGRDFVDGSPACLVLGDNIFHGHGLSELLQREAASLESADTHGTLDLGVQHHGCSLFGYAVADPERYGVAEVDDLGRIVAIEEKPEKPRTNIAITGLYFYDGTVTDRVTALRPSARGELEITDLNLSYVADGSARLVTFGRGMAWLDTGTHESLLEAATFVQVLEHRQGEQIACLEEIAFRMGWIGVDELDIAAAGHGRSRYGDHLRRLAASDR
jgi:glucose-1-phosphate thymidylyltransferase